MTQDVITREPIEIDAKPEVPKLVKRAAGFSWEGVPVGQVSSTRSGVHSIQEQRERWDRKRKRTGRELVQREQRYCEKLELITTYFVEILKAKGTLRQDIRESIFSSIKSIHLVNQKLLGHLENGNVGGGFDQFCPHLHFYTTYADNFHPAKKILAVQLKKNKAFRRFKKLQEARPEFHKLKLEDLLPLPLERIQHYISVLCDVFCSV